MCNPRRVRIVATREVVEAWQREVQRRSSVSGTVVSEARIARPFGDTLGLRTREVFERALAADPEWQEADGLHRLPLPNAEVTYRSDTGELTVTARLETTVTAEGVHSVRVQGTERGVVTGRGEAGHRAMAHQAAQSDAERKAQEMLSRVRRNAERAAAEAEQATADDVQAQADHNAQSRLDATRLEAQRDLDARNRGRLEELGQAGLQAVNAVLGRAYQEALLIYAREHGATGIRIDESADDVVEIEFELEA